MRIPSRYLCFSHRVNWLLYLSCLRLVLDQVGMGSCLLTFRSIEGFKDNAITSCAMHIPADVALSQYHRQVEHFNYHFKHATHIPASKSKCTTLVTTRRRRVSQHPLDMLRPFDAPLAGTLRVQRLRRQCILYFLQRVFSMQAEFRDDRHLARLGFCDQFTLHSHPICIDQRCHDVSLDIAQRHQLLTRLSRQ